MLRLYLAIGFLAAFAGGIWWYGDSRYDAGRASYKAEVEAAIAAKNEDIRKANAEDAEIESKEHAAEIEAVTNFTKNATEVQSFILDHVTAEALNAFGGE